MKRKRCGSCEGCTRPDCGICKCCMDKPRFGGLGKRKQCCELKKCRLLLSTPIPSPLVLQSLTSVEESSVSSPPVKRSKTSEESIVPTVTIEKFLQNSGRKIHHIKGDGNCMFRTFSYAFLNREEHHFHLRSHIVRTINLNQKVFSEYLMPINKPTIKEQVEHMLRDHVWGTHLEVKAAATLFQIPIYCCTQQSLQHDVPFTWSVVQPIPLNLAKLPYIIDEVAQEKEEISHIELFHHNGHYDAIVSLENGKLCTEAPRLTGEDDLNVINILN